MKRPLVWVVVPYIIGIAVADALWIPFWYVLAACILLLALANTLTDGGVEIVIRRNSEWQIKSMQGREVSTPRVEMTTP